jgi:hypothetical protein
MNEGSEIYQCTDCSIFFWEVNGDIINSFEGSSLRCESCIENSLKKQQNSSNRSFSRRSLANRLSINQKRRKLVSLPVSESSYDTNQFSVESDTYHKPIPSLTEMTLAVESKLIDLIPPHAMDLFESTLTTKTVELDSQLNGDSEESDDENGTDGITDENHDSTNSNRSGETMNDKFFCVICHLDLSNRGLTSRTAHLKKCAKDFNVSTKELLTMLKPVDPLTQPNAPIAASSEPPSYIYHDDASSSGQLIIYQINESVEKENIPHQIQAPPPKTNRKRSWWMRKKESSTPKRYAPNYKKIKSLSMSHPIVVDGFQFASKALTDCYFLTHFHSDHYIGLDKSFDCGR